MYPQRVCCEQGEDILGNDSNSFMRLVLIRKGKLFDCRPELIDATFISVVEQCSFLLLCVMYMYIYIGLLMCISIKSRNVARIIKKNRNANLLLYT